MKPLSFHEARLKVHKGLKDVLDSQKKSHDPHHDEGQLHFLMYILIPPSVCTVILGIAAAFSSHELYVGLGTAVVLIVLCTILNLNLVWRVQASEQGEVRNEVNNMLEDYSSFLKIQIEENFPLGENEALLTDDQHDGIVSGHPHIGVVTAYRNQHWQRIPTLLLAEGDVIALMGGDITPGKVWELEPVRGTRREYLHTRQESPTQAESDTTAIPDASMGLKSQDSTEDLAIGTQLWRRGDLLSKGLKVSQRSFSATPGNPGKDPNPKDSSTSTSTSGSGAASALPSDMHSQQQSAWEGNRTVASDSVDLLILSGDIRCYQMAETPISDFAAGMLEMERADACCDTFTGNQVKPIFPVQLFKARKPQLPGDIECAKSSLLRWLFSVILQKSMEFMLVEVLLLSLAVAIKLSVIPEARNHWAETSLLPLASIVLCFIPISLPLILLSVEALVMGDLLTTTELILLGEDEDDDDGDGVSGSGSGEYGEKGTDEKDLSVSATAEMRNGLGDPTSSGRVGDGKYRRLNSGSGYDFRDDSSDDSDFDDDDIDERIEEEATEDSKFISTWRWLQYVYHVLRSRLGWRSVSSDIMGFSYLQQLEVQNARKEKDFHSKYEHDYLSDLSQVPFLPVPLMKHRTLEVLGAVSMICFVDDDVICEPYSVCEEVFLLNSTQEGTQSGAGAGADEHTTSSGPKGVVLDLHATPEATGSRFEDPHWWKHLSSLKPIALNALLTHAPTPPTQMLSDGNTDIILSSDRSSGVLKKPIDGTTSVEQIAIDVYSEADIKSVPQKQSVEPIELTTVLPTRGPLLSTGPAKASYSSQMQDSLVGHIRKAEPMESLRELAEEIGFVDDDVSAFIRLLEANIVAPGLTDVKLLDDIHAWGQEDTRKRGTLMSHARGAVVQDTRGGGLQFMSQGDPALILNYCREFWDGSNITPFSPSDRKQLLSIYERWEMEDFDVLAFAYSPVPSSLRPLIVSAYRENLKKRKHFSKKARTDKKSSDGSEVLSHKRYVEGNSLFFVDPRTAAQLQNMEKKVQGMKTKLEVTSDNTTPSAAPGEVVNDTKSEARSVDNNEHDLYAIGTNVSLEGSLSSYASTDMVSPRYSSKSESLRESFSSRSERLLRLDLNNASMSVNSADADEGGAGMATSRKSASQTSSGNGEFSNLESPKRWRSDTDLVHAGQIQKRQDVYFGDGDGDGDGDNDEDNNNNNDEDDDDVDDDDVDNADYEYDGGAAENPEQMDMKNLHKNTKDPAEQEQREKRNPDSQGDEDNLNEMNGADDSASDVDDEDYEASGGRDAEYNEVSGRTEEIFGLDSDEDEDEDDEEQRSSAGDESAGEDLTSSSYRRSQSVDDDGGNWSHSGISKGFENPSDRQYLGLDLDDTSADRSGTTSLEPSQSEYSVPSTETHTTENNVPHGPPLMKTVSLDRGLSCIRDAGGGPATLDAVIEGSSMHDYTALLSKGNLNGHLFGQSPRTSAARPSKLRRTSKNIRRLSKSLGASLWPLMRQQVFLGMAASSVPVKMGVSQLMEDLTAAGVRFVYFSPRNMRRSKPVAEKIGIQFDWNCAISLRELSPELEADPHRYISSYADWDVHAQMPHGVPAIKRHLQEVDNVPLLVSLYTDSTPESSRQMVEVFRSYGEIVLAVGSAYRASNNSIFRAANMSVSVSMLPGCQQKVPIHSDCVFRDFPFLSQKSLTRADLLLVFRLVGLGSMNILQTPPTTKAAMPGVDDEGRHKISLTAKILPGLLSKSTNSAVGPELNMEAILEAVRKGRVLLLNMLQGLAMMCVSLFALALWPLAAYALPTAVPPSLSPSMALLFLFIYIPILLFAIMNSPAPQNVLKMTPRKNVHNVTGAEEWRFVKYLLTRSGFVVLSTYLIGWVSIAGIGNPGEKWYMNLLKRTDLIAPDPRPSLQKFFLIQDLMSIQMLIGVISQMLSMLQRGQTWSEPSLPTPWKYPLLYKCLTAVIIVHAIILTLRAFMRDDLQRYAEVDYIVWVIMIVLSVGGWMVGLVVNTYDAKKHRLAMQFLRLDFDTKLGMHSPR